MKKPAPLEVLTKIGLTPKEANAFLNHVENSFTTNIQPARIVMYRQRITNSFNLKSLLIVVSGYALLVWLYVIAMQLRFPESVYWPLALWLPIRMDYFGESAFLLSFILVIVVAIRNTKFKSTNSPTNTTN